MTNNFRQQIVYDPQAQRGHPKTQNIVRKPPIGNGLFNSGMQKMRIRDHKKNREPNKRADSIPHCNVKMFFFTQVNRSKKRNRDHRTRNS
ncbi:hypothetical protein D3C72_1439350 [compost metagenome]